MPIALRPRARASVISSRYGSHALALGARPGRGIPPESVDTSALVAEFGGRESVDTSAEMAGFDATRGRWTPPAAKWPVLILIRWVAQARVPRSRRLSDSR